MKRVPTILGVLCLLPVAYLVYAWLICADCSQSGDTWFYSFVAFLSLPFLLGIFAVVSAISGARATRDNLAERQPARAALSGGFTWVAILVAVPMLYASYQLYGIFFPEIEEGRDRLGRICEEEGNRTVCRPDPERVEETGGALGDLNRARREQRGL